MLGELQSNSQAARELTQGSMSACFFQATRPHPGCQNSRLPLNGGAPVSVQNIAVNPAHALISTPPYGFLESLDSTEPHQCDGTKEHTRMDVIKIAINPPLPQEA